jgi:hypothetical protein
MNYDIRKDEPAFPALPEKEGATPVKPPETSPPAPQVSRLAELANRYEPEVFELVRDCLDEGQSEDAVVATLKSHDFGAEEARAIVQAVIEDRRRVGIRRRPIRSSYQRTRDEAADEVDGRYPPPRDIDAKEAAARDMAFGMLWFVGGILLTAVTHSLSRGGGGVIFYGAVLWGGFQFLRGLVKSIGSRG